MPARELRHGRLTDAVEQALQIARNGTDAIDVSVDIDCIDHAPAPGTAAPNPFGLDLRELHDALRRIGSAPDAVGLDLVELSPQFNRDNMTGRAGASLRLGFLHGLSRRAAPATA